MPEMPSYEEAMGRIRQGGEDATPGAGKGFGCAFSPFIGFFSDNEVFKKCIEV